MENNLTVEERLKNKNIEIKNLKYNRNINFAKSAFSFANMQLSFMCGKYCVNYGFKSNGLYFIPAALVFILYGYNFVKFISNFSDLFENIRDIKELKKIKAKLEIYKNLDDNQDIPLREICKTLNKKK